MFKKLFGSKSKPEQTTPRLAAVSSDIYQQHNTSKNAFGGNQQQQQPQPQAQAPPPQTRVTKKDEVNLLLQAYIHCAKSKDNSLLKNLLAKTIKIMTMGFNVSPLFTNIVNIAITDDLAIKKMAYLFLVHTAKQNEELSILAINTFLKDCRHHDPKVRGLAIRSLTSLRVPSVVEYMMKPIGECIIDKVPYVRRCAVMGLLKAYYMDAETVIESGILTNLGTLIQDSDPLVAIDSIRVILELEVEFEVNGNVIHPLLNRLGEFNEWGLCTILLLLSKYIPSNEDELFNIMNLLEPALRQHNTAVVLSTVNCYLNFARNLPDIKQQIYYRIKQPLLTLMSNPSFEISYCILKHLYLMLLNNSDVFKDEYKQFYIKYNENISISLIKIKILPLLTNEYNYTDICLELVEYVIGSNELISRESIKSIANIAILIPESSDLIQETLMEFLDVDFEYIRSETMCVFQDLLRIYPNMCHDIVPIVPFMLKRISDSRGRSACLWILSTFPTLADEAPYAVEAIIHDYNDIDSYDVKLSLLTCTLKLFFERPPECKNMLAELFQLSLQDKKSPDLYDRALLYYKLLKYDVNTAKKLLGSNEVSVNHFINEDKLLEEKLFEEFNTLSVIYNKQSMHFIPDKELFIPQLTYDDTEEEEDESSNTPSKPSTKESTPTQSFSESSQSHQPPPPSQPQHQQQEDDLINFGSSSGNNNINIQQQSPPTLNLIKPSPLDPPSFQKLWTSLQTSNQLQIKINKIDINIIVNSMLNNKINLMASGDKGAILQFFFYGEDINNNIYLILCVLQKSSGIMDISIRTTTDKSENIALFAHIVYDALDNL